MGAVSIKLNPKHGQNFFDWHADYVESFGGMSRTIAFINRSAKLSRHFVNSPVLKDLQHASGATLGTFGLIQIPGDTREAYRSICALNEEDGGSFHKKVLKACKDVLSAIKSWASAFHIFFHNTPLRILEKTCKLGKVSADFSMTLQDYSFSSELSEYARGSMKEAVDYSRNYYFLRLVKNITTIASLFFTVVALAFNLTLLPALATATISLASTMIGIEVDYIKDTGRYHVIKFN